MNKRRRYKAKRHRRAKGPRGLFARIRREIEQMSSAEIAAALKKITDRRAS